MCLTSRKQQWVKWTQSLSLWNLKSDADPRNGKAVLDHRSWVSVFPFDRWKYWDPERGRDLLKVTQWVGSWQSWTKPRSSYAPLWCFINGKADHLPHPTGCPNSWEGVFQSSWKANKDIHCWAVRSSVHKGACACTHTHTGNNLNVLQAGSC